MNVTGTAELGQPLTADAVGVGGTPDPAIAYVWQSATQAGGPWSDIDDADAATFTPGAGQAGQWVRVVATAINGVGDPADAVSQPLGPVVGTAPHIAAVTVTGTARIGSVLTAQPQSVTGVPAPTVGYQWQVGTGPAGSWTNVSGATSRSAAGVTEGRRNGCGWSRRVQRDRAGGRGGQPAVGSGPRCGTEDPQRGVHRDPASGCPPDGARVRGVGTADPGSDPPVADPSERDSDVAHRRHSPQLVLPPTSAGARVRLLVTAYNGVAPAAVGVSPISRPVSGPGRPDPCVIVGGVFRVLVVCTANICRSPASAPCCGASSLRPDCRRW